MEQSVSGTAQGPARVPLLDLARTGALAGMVVFHTMFDLQMFGLVPPWTVQSAPWPLVARLVAGSFLFLAGVSLWLAHGERIRWRAFLRRLTVLVAAAALVSIATYAAMPGTFIYFGVLHSIAAASLIGLAVLRLPVWAILVIAAAIYAAPAWLASDAFNSPAFWWTGLATAPRPSLDFEPVLPWAAPCLAGLALAKAASAHGLWDAARTMPPVPSWLTWPGRHSLAIYLVHQPVLIGLIWTIAQIVA